MLGACLTLVSCGILPAQGPQTASVLSQAAYVTPAPEATKDGHSGFVVVKLDDSTLRNLAEVYRPSLKQAFGTGQPSYQSKIGLGDSVQLTIWEAGQGGLFTSATPGTGGTPGATTIPSQAVGSNGTIAVPFVGRIRAAGQTPSSLERLIVARLDGKAIDPQVVVVIQNRISGTVNVVSDTAGSHSVVLSPAGDRVLDVIARAGIAPAPASDAEIKLARGSKIAKIAFSDLAATPQENIYLRPGDNLFFDSAPKQLSVFGAAGQNTVIEFGASGIQLDQVLAKAGGLLDQQADPTGVFVMREENVRTIRQVAPEARLSGQFGTVRTIYQVDMSQAASYFRAHQFKLRDGDIVYVATSPANTLQKFITLLTGTRSVIQQ